MFSMWFTYIHCRATDVFSMGPPRDYVSILEAVIEREWRPRQSRKKGSAEYLLWTVVNLLRLREIVQEGVNKSSHPVQNTLLVTRSHKHMTIQWTVVHCRQQKPQNKMTVQWRAFEKQWTRTRLQQELKWPLIVKQWLFRYKINVKILSRWEYGYNYIYWECVNIEVETEENTKTTW
jgi:hypothetical protein